MVMAAASVPLQPAFHMSLLEGEGGAAGLHERLVDYVRALSGGDDSRAGVWGEHSYARARPDAERAAPHVRVLLATGAPPAAAAPDDPVDVLRVEPRPEPPRLGAELGAEREPEPEPEPADGDDWEEAVRALAPSRAHARLADAAADALRRLRLARLAGAAEGAARRAAARRLRLALGASAAGGARGAAWLHATLAARLPRGARALYDAAVDELRRLAPGAAARLAGPGAAAGASPPPAERGPGVSAAAPGPWLVWAGACRWEPLVRRLVHSRVLRGALPPAAAPDAWCSAAAGALSHALSEVLAEAGPERTVVLCGAGGDAALCCAAAGAPGAGGPGPGRLGGLLLLAPPLLTAEGARDSPDDPLAEVRLPLLMVTGGNAASCRRGAARELCAAGAGSRRLLELAGADDALRPAGERARLRLPRLALDAAVADECARWACDLAEGGPGRPSAGTEMETDEYAHLAPPAASPATDPSEPAMARRACAAEGRVVSRGTGGTPLPLAPPGPRRAPPPAPGPPAAPARLAAADIMQLPIVFADDEPAAEGEAAAGAALTVTSGDSRVMGGGRRFTRVIVAKRGAGAGAGAPSGAGAGAAGKTLLLRRPLRIAHPQ